MQGKSDRACLIITLLRDGYSLSDAAKKAGVAPSTLALWRRRGREDRESGSDTWYARFWQESEDARYYACAILENALYADALAGSAAAGLRWLDKFAPDDYDEKIQAIRYSRAQCLCERLADEY